MQRLAMTPELKRALKELRKSRLELEQAVRDELLRQPVLAAVKELAADRDDPKDE